MRIIIRIIRTGTVPIVGIRQYAMRVMSTICTIAISFYHMHTQVDEHVITVSATNPEECTPETRCSHTHGPSCGHQTVPHGGHIDYLVNGRLHHPHGDHCDDHGPIQLA